MGREQDQDLLTQEVCDVTSEEQKFTCQGDKIAPVKNTGLYVTASGKYCKFNITKRYEISIIAVRSLGFNTKFANFPPPPPKCTKWYHGHYQHQHHNQHLHQDQAKCRSRRLLLAEVDSTLRDLHNCSDHTKAESNSCFITLLKLFML